MRRIPITILALLLFGFVLAETPANELQMGNRAFAESDYKNALKYYKQAKKQGNRWEWLNEMIELVKVRQELGSIDPVVHKVCVIFVVEHNLQQESGEWVSSINVTPEQITERKMDLALMKQVLEALSRGNYTIDITIKEARATTALNHELTVHNPDALDLGEFFFNNIDRFDTFITYSNDVSPAMALARQYPYINGVLYSQPRGLVNINPGTHGFETLLHEFFHTVEWISGGICAPAHSFRKNLRHNVPEWKGDTELNYYQWHFEEKLPAFGWENMNHTGRYPRVFTEAEYVSIREKVDPVYSDIPYADRYYSSLLVDSAGDFSRAGDMEAYRETLLRALEISPYNTKALERVAYYYKIDNPDFNKCMEYTNLWAQFLPAKKSVMKRNEMLLRFDRIDLAIGALEEAIEELPGDGELYFELGRIYTYHKQDRNTPLVLYSKAIENNYDKPVVYHSMGMAYFHLKDDAKGIDVFERSITMNIEELKGNKTETELKGIVHEIADSYLWLTKIYDRSGDYEKMQMAARKGYEYEQNSQVGRWLKGADEKATAKLKDR